MRKKKTSTVDVLLHVYFIFMCACFVIPLMLIVSASLTSEAWLTSGNGFSIFPKDFTLAAYKSAFANTERMVGAYVVTIAESVLGTILSCIVAGMVAYPLSRTNFRFKMPITMFIFFTMLFSAGMIPEYIVFSKYYNLNDTFWVYILPFMTGGAWNTMVFRTFFKGLPEALFESAKIDGASELRIFFNIVTPLSKPVFASIGFMTLVSRWNDYMTSMIYIKDESLYTLQYLLQRLMNEAAFLKNLATMDLGAIDLTQMQAPNESLKFALCIIAAGPMLLIFPFFQKYFSQGLTVGAVKG